MTNQELDKIEDLLKLENLITKHRDRFELRYSDERDLQVLLTSVDEGIVKDEITHWCFIILVDKHGDDTARVFLTGYRAEGFPVMTSFVQKVDFERMAVITNSGSLYMLSGEPAEIPVGPDLVLAIAATFNAWSVGPVLGMPTATW